MQNKILLIGKILENPTVKKNIIGQDLCEFELEVKRRTGRIDIVPCRAWDNNALFMVRNIKKGDILEIEGNVRVLRRMQENGKMKNITTVRAEIIEYSLSNLKEEHNSND